MPAWSNPVRQFLPQDYWDKDIDWDCHNLDFNVLGASAADAKGINIGTEADFLCLSVARIITTLTGADVEQTFGEQTIRVFDSGSGGAWMDSVMHLDAFAGRPSVDGHGPRHLEVPRFVPAGGTITVELQNLEATSRRIFLSFAGCKIYKTLRRNG